MDDGIRDAATRFGSGGDKASLTLYIRNGDREILDDLVQLHFHR